jgi:hypothetical protein
VPVSHYPARRVPSLWFDHQPGIFERQHRLWPGATLYDLSSDIGETKDVASQHPEVVAGFLQQAREYDAGFQTQIAPVIRLPGPQPPAPGRIRRPEDDVAAWLELIR